jgi:hypothetical protein
LHHKHRDWIKTLAIETDKTITQLDIKEQEYMRKMVANNIQKLINKQNTNTDRRQVARHKMKTRE